VAGVLPLAELPAVQAGKGPRVAVVRCQLDASAAGPVAVRLNAAQGITLWLDGKPVPARERLELNVAAGRHTLTFALEPGKGARDLRCEVDEVSGSPARVNPVGGK
jgi:hypothetical protein